MRSACLVFIGGLNREAPYFQGARGVGLSVHGFNEETLETPKLAETNDIDNPTFLPVSPDGARIYANSEVFAWREGTVSADSFDRATTTLSYLNKQPSLGSIIAHNTITRDGTKLLVANYGMGERGPDRAVAVYGFAKNGALSAPLASVSHAGTGPNMARRERSHAHSVTETIAGGTAIVADLGIGRLVSYRIEVRRWFDQACRIHSAAGCWSTPSCLAPQRTLRLRHERAGLDRRFDGAGRSQRQALDHRRQAGGAGRGA